MSQQNSQGTGLQENVAGLLCYVLGWVTGIVFLILEPNRKFVKFHAVQSIIVFGAVTVVDLIFIWVPVVSWIIGVLALILWVFLMYQAYQGKMYKLPIAGVYAEKIASGATGSSNPPAAPPANPPAAPPAPPANPQ
ncbi:MAG: hypothetical protein WC370_04480 [Dehalococcoidales bacterium]